MFALTIYNQLTKEDVSNGLKIAGTGELDYEGNVLPIGGIDKKVIAADKEDVDILFAPSFKAHRASNYEVAKETAEEIDSDLEIVPVKKFSEDRKSTRLNSSHVAISYAVFCLKKKTKQTS